MEKINLEEFHDIVLYMNEGRCNPNCQICSSREEAARRWKEQWNLDSYDQSND